MLSLPTAVVHDKSSRTDQTASRNLEWSFQYLNIFIGQLFLGVM